MKKLTTLLQAIFLTVMVMGQNQPNFNWAMHFGGDNDDNINAIATDWNENIYTTGTFRSDPADFDPGMGQANYSADVYGNIFVAKYNHSGEYDWAFSIGSQSTIDHGNAIVIDDNGYLSVAGEFSVNADFDPGSGFSYETSNGYQDAFIATYDSDGNYQSSLSFGSIGNDYINGIAVDNLGNRYVVGRFGGNVDFDPDPVDTYFIQAVYHDAFVAKYSFSGDFIWAFSIGGSTIDEALDISIEPVTNDIVVSGYFTGSSDFDPGTGNYTLTGAGYEDIFVASYTSDAVLNWAHGFGSSHPTEFASSVDIDIMGNVYIFGQYGGLIDFDPGTEEAFRAPVDGSADIFLAKYNSAGAFQWVNSMGGAGNDYSSKVVVDNEQVFICGQYNSYNANFDPNSNNGELPTPLNNDAYVAKYDADGNFQWVGSFPGNLESNVNSLAFNHYYGLILGGHYQGLTDFDLSAGSANMSTPGTGNECFIAYYLVDCALEINLTEYNGTIYCGVENGTYQWVDCDNNMQSIPGATQNSYTPAQSGNYAVIVTQYDCVDTSDCVEVIINGIEDRLSGCFSVFPNPAKDKVFINTVLDKKMTNVSIVDMQGVLVDEFILEPTQTTIIDVSKLRKGFYILNITTNEESTIQKRLLIQ